MGGVHHTFYELFLISDFVLQDTKNIFCQCYQNCLRHLWFKFVIFQMSERWCLWHLKGGFTPPHKSRGVLSDMATASRLNTLYGLETWYVWSSRHVKTIQNVLDISNIFGIFMTSSMSDFFFSFCTFWLQQVS